MTNPESPIQPDDTEPTGGSGRDPLRILIPAAWGVGLAAIALAVALWLWSGGRDDTPPEPPAADQIPPAMRPEDASASALQTPPFHIRRDTDAAGDLFADLGLDAHRFHIKTRPDRKVLLWVELYKAGELQRDRSFGVMYEPQPDRPVHDTLRFTRLDSQVMRETSGNEPGRVRWTLGIGSSATRRWLDDPVQGLDLQASPPATPTVWELGSGKTRTLWHLAAATNETGSVKVGSEADRRKNALYIALKCRVVPADPDRSGATFKRLSRIPPE